MTERIEGTPLECGMQVFERFCLPALHAVRGESERDIAALYAGFIMAALGAMTADFGHAQAVSYAVTMLERFESAKDELEGARQ